MISCHRFNRSEPFWKNLATTAVNLHIIKPGTVAVFGATGTIGDGLFKALINSPNIEKIHVITRSATPRMNEGVTAGKVILIIHNDYLDYVSIHEVLAEVDAVYWALGVSAEGLDKQAYREIHADFPLSLVKAWLSVSERKLCLPSLLRIQSCG